MAGVEIGGEGEGGTLQSAQNVAIDWRRRWGAKIPGQARISPYSGNNDGKDCLEIVQTGIY